MVSHLHHKFAVHHIARLLAGIAGVTLLTVPLVNAVEVEAKLDRESVTAGNGALLTLRVSGGRANPPEIPVVENLVIQQRGQNQQIQIINGQTTVAVTYNYVVGSNIPGDYQIPAIDVMINNKKFSSRPIKLKVLDAAAAQAPAGLRPNKNGAPPGGDEAADTGENRFGFLTVELADNDRKHVYVGEIAPVRIQAWIPTDARVQLRSGIQPEGKAFTIHNVSEQPQQTREIKDGKHYIVVTWYGGISATKAGKYPVSLSLNATVAVRDKSAQQPRRRMGGPFDDPFFDQIFDDMQSPMIQKDVTLKSNDQDIEVRPLPSDGRPTGFSGAVGKFKIESSTIPTSWKTGEPLQITARLSGSGNFALMNAPVITPSDAWKTYPGKGEFTSGDEASFSGSKSFQFSAVPLKGGAQDMALAFSFFNPDSGTYQTVTTPTKNIQVLGADVAKDVPTPAVVNNEPAKTSDILVAQQLKMSRPGSLVPLVSKPAFIHMLGIAVILAVFGKFLSWLRMRRADPGRLALVAMEKATREAIRVADHCAASQDAAGFFAAARLALQQRLGMLWNQPASAITSAEVNARMAEESPVARFFREADLHEYSRQATGDIDPRWRTLLNTALASLTPTAR